MHTLQILNSLGKCTSRTWWTILAHLHARHTKQQILGEFLLGFFHWTLQKYIIKTRTYIFFHYFLCFDIEMFYVISHKQAYSIRSLCWLLQNVLYIISCFVLKPYKKDAYTLLCRKSFGYFTPKTDIISSNNSSFGTILVPSNPVLTTAVKCHPQLNRFHHQSCLVRRLDTQQDIPKKGWNM